jgi:hypothetical protein
MCLRHSIVHMMLLAPETLYRLDRLKAVFFGRVRARLVLASLDRSNPRLTLLLPRFEHWASWAEHDIPASQHAIYTHERCSRQWLSS